jgi:universal stress protein A
MPRRTAGARAFNAILCPVDFSANSEAALRYAAILARNTGCPLFVVYVDDPLLAAVAATRKNAKAVLQAGERDLRRFVRRAAGMADDLSVTLITVAGKPSKEIVKVAERHDCDLIVIGYRGVGGASRLLFGSTTEGVMKATSIPVLAIPPAARRAARSDVKRRRAASARAARPR